MSAARAGTSGAATSGAAEGTRLAAADTVGRLLGRLVRAAGLGGHGLVAGRAAIAARRPVHAALMLALSVPLAVVLVVLGLRWLPDPCRIPGRWRAASAGTQGPARTPWWTVASVIAIAVGFGVDQMIYHSQLIMVIRDPASYLKFAFWIARHGSLPIPQ